MIEHELGKGMRDPDWEREKRKEKRNQKEVKKGKGKERVIYECERDEWREIYDGERKYERGWERKEIPKYVLSFFEDKHPRKHHFHVFKLYLRVKT